jgi:PAS domain S-box-containing protein
VARVLRDGRPVALANHTALVAKDGREIPIEDSAAPILDAAGQVIGVVLVFHYVTEKRRTEEALHASEERYRALVDLSPDAIVVVQDGRFVFANAAALRLYGADTSDAIIGRPVLDIAHPDDRELVRERLERALRGEPTALSEVRGVGQGGQPMIVEALGAAVDFNGRRAVQVILRDISERKRTEDRLRLLSAAIESAANGIAVTDCRGTILWVNPAFSTLTGYSQAEAVGQNPRVLKSGQHPPEFYRQMWQTILAGRDWRGELVNRRKDGSLYTEEMTITPVKSADAAVTHFIAIKQDITERRQAEEALRATNEELARFNRTMVNRELRMVGLKKQVNELCAQVGQPPRYPLEFESGPPPPQQPT